jgi:hypothetical protein
MGLGRRLHGGRKGFFPNLHCTKYKCSNHPFRITPYFKIGS